MSIDHPSLNEEQFRLNNNIAARDSDLQIDLLVFRDFDKVKLDKFQRNLDKEIENDSKRRLRIFSVYSIFGVCALVAGAISFLSFIHAPDLKNYEYIYLVFGGGAVFYAFTRYEKSMNDKRSANLRMQKAIRMIRAERGSRVDQMFL